MILIKIGGGEKINLDFVCEDIAQFWPKEKLIVVHGAGKIRDRIAEKLSVPTKYISSPSGIVSVFTDKTALEIFLMVYCGLVNKTIVAKLQKLGVNALGLSGLDGRIWEGKWKKEILVKEGNKIKLIKNTFTGKVEKINDKFIKLLIENNFLPVICPPAISFEGQIINVDNDLAISQMVKALKIEKMISLFEAPGFLRDEKDEASLIKKIEKEKLNDYLKFAKGTMKKKIMGAQLCFEAGIKKIYFGDGRIKNPIKNALSGKGTIIF